MNLGETCLSTGKLRASYDVWINLVATQTPDLVDLAYGGVRRVMTTWR